MMLLVVKGSWMIEQNTRYLFPASCDRWIAVALVAANDRFTKNDLQLVRIFTNFQVSLLVSHEF